MIRIELPERTCLVTRGNYPIGILDQPLQQGDGRAAIYRPARVEILLDESPVSKN
ncbi:MAG: hypothetical protein WD733_15965 [Bryobacterales bacterium]